MLDTLLPHFRVAFPIICYFSWELRQWLNVSHVEQLTQYARFVNMDSSDINIHDHFLSLIFVEATTESVLNNSVLNYSYKIIKHEYSNLRHA